MGNICSGGKEESKKASAFAAAEDSDTLQVPDIAASTKDAPDSSNGMPRPASSGAMASAADQASSSAGGIPSTAQGEAQLKAMREEQNRLELIVQMAGRGMVSVRSTRGSTGYYDQGFAAALGQHLEQTTKFPDSLPIRLPPISSSKSSSSSPKKSNSGKDDKLSTGASNNSTVYQRLAQPQWEGIVLGKKGTGLAGCEGENPNTYMDHLAASFLDSVVPKKERLFHGGVGPMVENLL
jgi:hypothetical protein